jgi:hypothetical protein
MAFPELTGVNTDEIQIPCLCFKTREPGMTNTPYRDGATHVMLEPMDFHRTSCGAGAQTPGEHDPVPWTVIPIVFLTRDAAD